MSEKAITAPVLNLVLEQKLDMTFDDIKKPSRKQEIVDIKRVLCHIMRQSGYSFDYVGKQLSINHSTVIYHCNRFEFLFSINDKATVEIYNKLINN